MQTYRDIVGAAVLVNAVATLLVLHKVIEVPFDWKLSTILTAGAYILLHKEFSPIPTVRHAS